MQDIEQLARELGAALQLSPAYVRWVAAKEQNEADDALNEMMRELELVRLQYQHEAAKNEQADQTLMEGCDARFRGIYDAIMANENMREYQAAAAALEGLAKRVTGIVSACARGEDPASCQPEESGCGGSCGGGCKGCG